MSDRQSHVLAQAAASGQQPGAAVVVVRHGVVKVNHWAGICDGTRAWPQTPSPALRRPRGLLDADVRNSERFRRTPFPTAALHADALSQAGFHDDLVRPDGFVAKTLGHDLWRDYTEPAATGHDLLLDRVVTWTLGFQISQEDAHLESMGGEGGCSAWPEPAAGSGAAYVTRGLGSHERGDDVVAANTAPREAP